MSRSILDQLQRVETETARLREMLENEHAAPGRPEPLPVTRGGDKRDPPPETPARP